MKRVFVVIQSGELVGVYTSYRQACEDNGLKYWTARYYYNEVYTSGDITIYPADITKQRKGKHLSR